MLNSILLRSLNRNKSLYEIYNFLKCGVISAGIYFITLYLCEIINPSAFGFNFSIAYLLSSSYNFFYNKIVTFDAGRTRIVKHGFSFTIMLIIAYFSNFLVIDFLVKNEILGLYWASAFAIIFNAFFRFICSKYIVFK